MGVKLEIPEDEFPAFLAYLGLGTLRAIKSGTVPPQVGIWTLARPNFLEFLNKQAGMPNGLIQVFRKIDELSAIDKLIPGQFDTEVEILIESLEVELRKMPNNAWSVKTD